MKQVQTFEMYGDDDDDQDGDNGDSGDDIKIICAYSNSKHSNLLFYCARIAS